MTEEEIYKYYSDKNPNSGKKLTLEDITKINETSSSNKKSMRLLLIPSWISGEDDKYYTFQKAETILNKYGLTNQMYYDIVILGISSPRDRPKCPCGNYTKYKGMFHGYKTYCNRDCMYKYREVNETFRTYNLGGKSKLGTHLSEETKKKISKANKGKKRYEITEETRRKLSKANKGRKITWKDKQREAALRRIERNPQEALRFVKSRGKSGLFKPNKSSEIIRYLSTWELKFMKWCDLSKDVIKIETAESIPYTYSGKDHIYIPDFKLTLDNNQIIIIEIKPKNLVNDPVVIAKRITAKKYCRKNNFKYVTLTEVELFKRIKGSFNIFDYIV